MKSHINSFDLLNEVLALGLRKQYKKGQLFKDTPTLMTPLYYIEKGVIISLSPVEEGYTTYWISTEHEFVFHNSFFMPEPVPDPMILEAIENLEVIEIRRDVLYQAYQTQPLLMEFGRLLAEYKMNCLETTNKIISNKSALKRYQLFQQLMPQINGRVPLKHIAHWLQMDQATLSRVRNKRNI